MKYTLDNIAYIITKDNYRFLNTIYNNYWKSNGYKIIGRRHGITDIIDLYTRNNALITQYTVCIVASDEGKLYLSDADYRQTLGYKVVNLNFKNLMKVE